MLSHTELERYMNVSINDFIPSNFTEFQLQFDDLGILKKVKLNAYFFKIATTTPKIQLFSAFFIKFIPTKNNQPPVTVPSTQYNSLNTSQQSSTSSINAIHDDQTSSQPPAPTPLEANLQTKLILKSVSEEQGKQYVIKGI